MYEFVLFLLDLSLYLSQLKRMGDIGYIDITVGLEEYFWH